MGASETERGRARSSLSLSLSLSLRHAAASLFIEQCWNPKKIQTIIGHASIGMTMDCYGHLFESADNDVALFEKMERDLMAA